MFAPEVDPDTANLLANMPRKRKAAMIMQMLLNNGEKLPLTSLPEKTQADLTRELGRIRLVDNVTLQAVAGEFADLLEAIGLSAPGNDEAALEAVGELISPDLARKLRNDLEKRQGADPWGRLITLEVEDLTPILMSESIEVGAIVISKLTVQRAAELLASLPGDRARRITIAVNRTENITPAAVVRIGQALVDDYCQAPSTAFAKKPVERIGAILNSTTAAVREDMLTGLTDEDENLGRDVRRAIFTFPDIPTRMEATDVPATLREVDPDTFGIALAYGLAAGGQLEESAEFILASISQRMASQMREDAAERGTVSEGDGERAMNEICASVRDLADAGTIKLIEPDEGG